MPNENISGAITDLELTNIIGHLEDVRGALTFLISLTSTERQRLFKAGATRSGAIPLAHQIATQFPEIFPGTFDKAEMDADVLLRAPLQTIHTELSSLLSAVDDTLLGLNAEAMKHVLEVYKYAKAAQDTVPGIKPLVAQLAVYFDRPSQPSSSSSGSSSSSSGSSASSGSSS